MNIPNVKQHTSILVNESAIVVDVNFIKANFEAVAFVEPA
jgi:hypothetical protein